MIFHIELNVETVVKIHAAFFKNILSGKFSGSAGDCAGAGGIPGVPAYFRTRSRGSAGIHETSFEYFLPHESPVGAGVRQFDSFFRFDRT